MSRKKSKDGPKLNEFIGIFLQTKKKQDELEVRFGTKFHNPITNITFNNTIDKLKSLGFLEKDKESYHLNIQNNYIDENSGRSKLSNIRTTIKGLFNIQKYCKTNTFDIENIPKYVTFMQKFNKSVRGIDERLRPIDYHDYEFRVNYKEERTLDKNNRLLSNILTSWADSKKTFRLIKRYTLFHPEFPFQVDFSIIKTSNHIKGKSWLKPTYTIEESNVFNNSEHFEIELELINEKAYLLNERDLHLQMNKGIQHILCGLQNTNYPVSYTEMDNVLKEYLQLTKTDKDFQLIADDNAYNRKKRKNSTLR